MLEVKKSEHKNWFTLVKDNQAEAFYKKAVELAKQDKDWLENLSKALNADILRQFFGSEGPVREQEHPKEQKEREEKALDQQYRNAFLQQGVGRHLSSDSTYAQKTHLEEEMQKFYAIFTQKVQITLGNSENTALQLAFVEGIKSTCASGMQERLRRILDDFISPLLSPASGLDRHLQALRNSLVDKAAAKFCLNVDKNYLAANQVHVFSAIKSEAAQLGYGVAVPSGTLIALPTQEFMLVTDQNPQTLAQTTLNEIFSAEYTLVKGFYALNVAIKQELTDLGYTGLKTKPNNYNQQPELRECLEQYLGKNTASEFLIMNEEDTEILDINWPVVARLLWEKLKSSHYLTPNLFNQHGETSSALESFQQFLLEGRKEGQTAEGLMEWAVKMLPLFSSPFQTEFLYIIRLFALSAPQITSLEAIIGKPNESPLLREAILAEDSKALSYLLKSYPTSELGKQLALECAVFQKPNINMAKSILGTKISIPWGKACWQEMLCLKKEVAPALHQFLVELHNPALMACFHALRKGELLEKLLDDLLATGTPIDACQYLPDGKKGIPMSLLMYAANFDRSPVLLLERGAKADCLYHEYTAVHWWIFSKKHNPETLKLLAECKATEPSTPHSFDTILHHAARTGLDVTKALVAEFKKNNKPLAVNTPLISSGDTPLHIATLYNKTEVLAFLAEMKADINAKNKQGLTPWMIALQQSKITTFIQLLESFASTIKLAPIDNNHESCLNMLVRAAIKNEDSDSMESIFTQVAKFFTAEQLHEIFNPHFHHQMTPLLIAISFRSPIAHLLIKIFNSHIDCSRIIYHHAAYYNDALSIKLLPASDTSCLMKDVRGQMPLHYAAACGSALAAEALFEKFSRHIPDMINAQDPLGLTPLHLALSNNKPEMIPILAVRGADVNVQDGKGLTPWHIALLNDESILNFVVLLENFNSMRDDALSIQLLSTMRADWEQGKISATSLHTVVRCGSPQAVDALCEKFPYMINAQDQAGDTPLHVALGVNKSEMIPALAAKGADVNVRDPSGLTPWLYALIKRPIINFSMLLKIFSKIDLTLPLITDGGNQTCLHLLADRGHDEDGETMEGIFQQITRLVRPDQLKIMLNTLDSTNRCPLLIALSTPSHIFSLLLGFFEPYIDLTKYNYLHYAARHNHALGIKLLAERGANCLAENRIGRTALHEAAQWGSTLAAEALFTSFPDKISLMVDVQTPEGDTPLHLAPSGNSVEMLRLLVTYGAKLETFNLRGQKPIHCGAKYGSEQTFMSLVDEYKKHKHSIAIDEADSDGDTCLHLASQNHLGTRIISTLKLLGASSINSQNKKQMTPWMLATLANNCSALILLLREFSQSIDLRIKNASGENGLHLLAQMHQISDEDHHMICAQVKSLPHSDRLKEALNSHDHAGFTPLMLMLRDKTVSKTRQLLYIFKWDLDPEVRDKSSWTSLHWAAEANDEKLIRNLADIKADPQAKDKNDQTPWHIAASGGCHTAAETLFDRFGLLGCHEKDRNGDTLAHRAIKANDAQMISLFVARGVNFNLFNNRLETPLIQAIKLQNMTIFTSLSKAFNSTLDINLKNKNHHSALREAVLSIEPSQKYLKVVTQLITAGAEIEFATLPFLMNKLKKCPGKNQHAFIKKMEQDIVLLRSCFAALAEGQTLPDLSALQIVSINSRNEENQTLVMAAVVQRRLDSLEKLLLRRDIAIDASDSSGHTAMHYATRDNNEACMQQLLKRKTKQVTSLYRTTPFWITLPDNHSAIIPQELLQACGSDICGADNLVIVPKKSKESKHGQNTASAATLLSTSFTVTLASVKTSSQALSDLPDSAATSVHR